MEMFISQQPKAIESRNWCQMIALTIFYKLVIRYINKLTFLLLKHLRKLKIQEKNHCQRKGVYQYNC